MNTFLSLLPLLIVGAIVLALFYLQTKHWVHFNIFKLKGNHPDLGRITTKFNNITATETGAVVSSSRLSTVFAVIFAALAVIVISAASAGSAVPGFS